MLSRNHRRVEDLFWCKSLRTNWKLVYHLLGVFSLIFQAKILVCRFYDEFYSLMIDVVGRLVLLNRGSDMCQLCSGTYLSFFVVEHYKVSNLVVDVSFVAGFSFFVAQVSCYVEYSVDGDYFIVSYSLVKVLFDGCLLL